MGRNQQLFNNPHLQLQPNPLCPPGQTIYSHDLNVTIQREMERRRIRDDIILSNIIMRRQLEAEVGREILFERQLASSQIGGVGFQNCLPPRGEFDSSTRLLFPGILLENRIAPPVDGGGRIVNNYVPFERGTTSFRISKIRSAEEAHVGKNRINLLAKADVNTSGMKRKAEETLPTMESTELSSDIIIKKKAKEEWKCEVCHISCTSEQSLKDHLRGKKHKSKQANAIARDGKNYSIGLLSAQMK